MHLSATKSYPWTLNLSDDELTVIQKVLRGDELSEQHEDMADHLSRTLDKIRSLIETTKEKRALARQSSRGVKESYRSGSAELLTTQ